MDDDLAPDSERAVKLHKSLFYSAEQLSKEMALRKEHFPECRTKGKCITCGQNYVGLLAEYRGAVCCMEVTYETAG